MPHAVGHGGHTSRSARPARHIASLLVVAVTGVALVVSACTDDGDKIPIEAGPSDPDAVIDERLIRAQPHIAAPGDDVDLLFPTEVNRGIGFTLERRTVGDWTHQWSLTSDAGPPEPMVHPGTEDVDWDAVGIDGPGPDRVRIPDDAEPGSYRICTAISQENICASIEIE